MDSYREESIAVTYRYGFQGQEKDDEIKGDGNSINYKYRMHDARIGRFLSIDPLTPNYPHYTPYSFSGNKVIAFVELEGLEEVSIHSTSFAPFYSFGGGYYGDGNNRSYGDKDVHDDRYGYYSNYRIRKIDTNGIITTIAGTDIYNGDNILENCPG